MFFDKREDKATQHEKLIQELSIRMEQLDREIDTLLKELKVTPDQLSTFIQEKDNFTEDNWLQLQEQRRKLDEKLLCELKNVSDPLKTKKNYEGRVIGSNWIHVR